MSTILKLNRLYALLLRFSEKPWHWKKVSFNQNITTEIVDRHPEWKWDWSDISLKDMTREFFEKHKKKLNLARALCHPCFTWKDVEDNLDKIPKDKFYDIWEKKQPDFDYILNSPKLMAVLHIGSFSFNRHITWEDVQKTKDMIRWDYDHLLSAPLVRVPLDFIENNAPWFKYDSIARHPTLTLEFVEKYIDGIPSKGTDGDHVWDWLYLMHHDWFTEEVYEKYSDEMEEYTQELLECKNISVDFLIEKDLIEDILDGYDELVVEKIPMDLLRKYEVSAEIAGYSREIPIEFSKGKKLPKWANDFDCEEFTVEAANMVMSNRQDIRCQHVVENHDKINWIALSENEFDMKRSSAKVIWRWWLIYKKKKDLEQQMKTAKGEITEEISLLPAAFINKQFPGGEEMRKANKRFLARSVKEFSVSQKEM